jgi:hypothetical protein
VLNPDKDIHLQLLFGASFACHFYYMQGLRIALLDFTAHVLLHTIRMYNRFELLCIIMLWMLYIRRLNCSKKLTWGTSIKMLLKVFKTFFLNLLLIKFN